MGVWRRHSHSVRVLAMFIFFLCVCVCFGKFSCVCLFYLACMCVSQDALDSLLLLLLVLSSCYGIFFLLLLFLSFGLFPRVSPACFAFFFSQFVLVRFSFLLFLCCSFQELITFLFICSGGFRVFLFFLLSFLCSFVKFLRLFSRSYFLRLGDLCPGSG